jgi:hypothetical protein
MYLINKSPSFRLMEDIYKKTTKEKFVWNLNISRFSSAWHMVTFQRVSEVSYID